MTEIGVITEIEAGLRADNDVLRGQIKELKEANARANLALADMAAECEKYVEQFKEADEDYWTLVGMLRKRFPRRADGSAPDFAIEDVLRENEQLKAELELIKTAPARSEEQQSEMPGL